jgi:nitrite reductase (NADH) small subunit
VGPPHRGFGNVEEGHVLTMDTKAATGEGPAAGRADLQHAGILTARGRLRNRLNPSRAGATTFVTMGTLVPVAKCDEVPPGRCRSAMAADREIALFNVGGTVYALDNMCPHRGGPLGEGDLQGFVVFCPLHAWQFDVRTGQCPTNPRACAEPIGVKVVDGVIHVEV